MATTTQLQLVISAKDEASRTLSAVSKNISNLSKSPAFGAIMTGAKAATAAVAAFGTSLSIAGGFAVKSAANFEQTAIAMETLIGNSEEAQKTLKEISDFAAQTPFEFPELADTTKQLLAFGFNSNDAVKSMKMLGDISAGLNVPMGDLAYLLGTLKTQGRAMTIDIRQFAQRGLPIYEELAKVMKVSVKDVGDLITAGKVGFPEVQKALESMTNEGGKFHGMMARQATSLSGLWSTLKDNIGFSMREIVGISTTGIVREGSIFDLLRKGAASLIEYLNANQANIISFFQNIINLLITVGKGWSKAKDEVKGFFQETNWVFVWMRDIFMPLFKVLKETASKAWKDISNAIEPIKPQLTVAAKLFGSVLLGAIVLVIYIIGSFTAAIMKIASVIIGTFSKAIQTITKVLEAFSYQIIKVYNAWNSLASLVRKGISGTINIFKNEKSSSKKKRAFGGSVMTGESYIVGEHRPEVFVPSQSGNIRQVGQAGGREISVTFNNVNVRSEYDLNQIIEAVKKTLSRDQMMASYGIRTT